MDQTTMKKAIAGFCLFGSILGAQAPSRPTTQCQAKIDDLRGAKPITVLPAAQQLRIVDALLADVTRFYRIVGGDPQNLQPDRLRDLLQFETIPGGRASEQLMIVRLVDSSCGANDNCLAYVISMTPSGVQSVLVGRNPSFGQSAGGASEVGILQMSGSTHPELLFLSHVSAFEVAVVCFTWNGSRYVNVRCPQECAHFLDRPRPSDPLSTADDRRR